MQQQERIGMLQRATQKEQQTRKQLVPMQSQYIEVAAQALANGCKLSQDKVRLRYGKKVLVVCDFSLSVPEETRYKIISMAQVIGESNPFMRGYVVKGGVVKNAPMKIENIKIVPETFALNYNDINQIIEANGKGDPDIILVLTDEPAGVFAGQTDKPNITGKKNIDTIWWNLVEGKTKFKGTPIVDLYLQGTGQETCNMLTEYAGIVLEL